MLSELPGRKELLQLLTRLPAEAEQLIANYDGANDSGGFEDIRIYGPRFAELYISQELREIGIAAQELFMEILVCAYSDWNQEDGSSGQFTVDVASKLLTHEHYKRIYTENEDEYDLTEEEQNG